MRLSKVAKLIGIDRKTIDNWINHDALNHLFSSESKKEGDRDVSESDIFTLNTIHYLRKNITTDWKEIAEKIEGGYQVTDLSIGATDVDVGKTPLQQFTRTLTIVQERDAALKRLAEVEEEMEQMREDHKRELEQERQASKKELENEREKSEIAKGQLMERLLREIAELRYEIGKLEEKSRENDE